MTLSLEIPGPLARVSELMSNFECPWALCGGWAVDSWLGEITRGHGDIDITVFESDQRTLFDYLKEWNLVAHDEVEPQAKQSWTGRALVLPAHLHAREPGEANAALVLSWVTPPYTQAKDDRDFEFIINEGAGTDWLLNTSPGLAISWSEGVRESPWGPPTAAPEVLAFYKATAYFRHKRLWARPHDIADFDALVPLLEEPRRRWLRDAITALHPDHPWLPQLE